MSIVWAVCGSGNNGADGIAAARMLHLKGYPVCIYMAGDENRGTVELKTQLSIARKLGISVRTMAGDRDRQRKENTVALSLMQYSE